MDTSSDHPFKNASVSFAVDISSSTRGRILETERNFIFDVSSMLSSSARQAARILPWDGKAHPVISLDGLDKLKVGIGTTPAVTLEDEKHREALRNCSVWFLITDGAIAENDREHFSRLISQYRMHGVTCVTVVCGSTHWFRPAEYDISVGVSLFAVAPNCLFLFNDIGTNEVLILGSKGIFKSFLGGRPNPVIDSSTSWGSFPRLNYDHFSSLLVPTPKHLAADEIELQGDLIVKFADLWNGRVSQEKVSQILANEDDITSLVMTSQTRNEVGKFQQWLRQQKISLDDPLHKPRQDIFNARAAFQDVITKVRLGQKPSKEDQSRLRAAYDANFKSFVAGFEEKRAESMARSTVIESSSSRARSTIHSAASLTPTPSYDSAPVNAEAPNVYGYYNSPFAVPPRDPPSYTSTNVSYYKPPIYPGSPWPSDPIPRPPAPQRTYLPQSYKSAPQVAGLLYSPGFRENRLQVASCRGECRICGSSHAVLAWLFQEPPTGSNVTITDGFPVPGSGSPIHFPFAMGNFPEVDVISNAVCCERCSWFCVQQKISPLVDDGQIIAALPAVSFADNKQAYLDVLERATAGRFEREELPLVFMAMLISTADALTQSTDQEAREQSQGLAASQFISTADWVCISLMKLTVEQTALSASLATPQISNPYLTLDKLLDQQMANAGRDANSPIIRYPLDGFPVLMRLARLYGGNTNNKAVLERVTLRRLLFALVEQYVLMAAAMSYPVAEVGDAVPDPTIVLKTLLWTANKSQGTLNEGVGVLETSTSGNCSGKSAKQDHLGNANKPVASVSIGALRRLEILDDPSYETLSGVAEFRALEKEPSEWTGPVIAVFLHTLLMARMDLTALATEEPWNLFSKVINHADIGAITSDPESIRETDARVIIEKVVAGRAT